MIRRILTALGRSLFLACVVIGALVFIFVGLFVYAWLLSELKVAADDQLAMVGGLVLLVALVLSPYWLYRVVTRRRIVETPRDRVALLHATVAFGVVSAVILFFINRLAKGASLLDAGISAGALLMPSVGFYFYVRRNKTRPE